MIARFGMSKSLGHVLSYNENKVKEGAAKCIGAEGFGLEPPHLTIIQKRTRFEKLTERNRNAGTNIAHITLSFAPGEQLSKAKLLEIAGAYMTKVGFEDQPYLVYEHMDTANMHIHIVSTIIRSDGSRIGTHLIGANASSVAREQIENEFGLVKAAGRGEKYHQGIPPLDLVKYLQEDKAGKPTIAAIVRNVIARYKFTSLAEFNAILRQFNVMADPGLPGSKLKQRRGLLYSGIDSNGEKVGAQVKSSTIYVPGGKGLPDNAGLTLLEDKFKRDHFRRRDYRATVLAKVENVVAAGVTRGELESLLLKRGVCVSFRYSESGLLSGVTFIDNEEGVAFKGSDLRKSMGAAGLSARLLTVDKLQRKIHEQFITSCLDKTDFKNDFASVLQQWKQMGLRVEARLLPEGETFFFMGGTHLQPPTMVPVPTKIDHYMRVNIGREDRRARRLNADEAAARYASFRAGLTSLYRAGDIGMSIIEEMVHAEEGYNDLPIELITEAKKRGKRKRNS